MKVLVPLEITDAMLISSTIAEPAAGEVAWVSGTTYAVDDVRIVAALHRKYIRLVAGAGTISPELDFANWTDYGPTARWAAFDTEVSTASATTTTMTYVLKPGFFNSIACYGLDGASISVTAKDATGGSVIFSYSGDLLSLPLDWYDWAFGVVKTRPKIILSGITPYPDAELTITISAGAGVAVGVGMIAIGDFRPFMGDVEWGGTQYGAAAELVNYSRISTDKYGTTKIINGRSVTDMRFKVSMPLDVADYFLANVQETLSTPAAWVGTDIAGFDGLNVFGLGSGSISYDSFGHAVFSGYVKGIV